MTDPCTESLSQHPAISPHVVKTWSSSTTSPPCPSCCIPGFTGVAQARAVALSWYSFPGSTFSDSSAYFSLSETSCSVVYKMKITLRKSRESHGNTSEHSQKRRRKVEFYELVICRQEGGFPCALWDNANITFWLSELSIHHSYITVRVCSTVVAPEPCSQIGFGSCGFTPELCRVIQGKLVNLCQA